MCSKKNKRKKESNSILYLRHVIYGENGIFLNSYENFTDKGENIL